MYAHFALLALLASIVGTVSFPKEENGLIADDGALGGASVHPHRSLPIPNYEEHNETPVNENEAPYVEGYKTLLLPREEGQRQQKQGAGGGQGGGHPKQGLSKVQGKPPNPQRLRGGQRQPGYRSPIPKWQTTQYTVNPTGHTSPGDLRTPASLLPGNSPNTRAPGDRPSPSYGKPKTPSIFRNHPITTLPKLPPDIPPHVTPSPKKSYSHSKYPDINNPLLHPNEPVVKHPNTTPKPSPSPSPTKKGNGDGFIGTHNTS